MEKESKQRPSSSLSLTSSSSSSSLRSTSSCRPSLKCVEEQAEHKSSMYSRYRELVHDYSEMIKKLNPEVGKGTSNREKRNFEGKCLELLADPKSKDLKQVELLKLSDFLKGLICFPSNRLRFSICEHIAEVMIIMHNKNRVLLNGCDEVVFTELAKSLAKVYRKAKNFTLFANAYDVLADILNEKYEVGELQSYSFKKLCCISQSANVFRNHEPHELRKITNMNIAKIIIERHAKNQIDTDDGKAISRVVRGLKWWCNKYNVNILRDALLCLANCLIAQYEKDELSTYKILDLYHIICYFNFEVDDDKEYVKSLILVFAEALNSRISEGKQLGLKFKRLIHILVKLGMLIIKVDDKISMKYALKFLSEQLAPEIDSSKEKYLPFITKAFNTLSMDDEKECLSSAMIATAKVIIQKHEDNLLQFIEAKEMIDYATAFRFWHNKDDVDKVIMKEAILSIANSLITKLKKGSNIDTPIMNFSNLVCSFGTFKDYDRNQSLRIACDMIAHKILEYHKRVEVLQYNLTDLCLFVDGFSKWYIERKSCIRKVLISMAYEISMLQNELPNIPPQDLATLANNYSKCYDIDDESFQLGLYKIAKTVSTIYESSKLREFNAEELMYLTSAFVKLHDRDDLRKTTRNGILSIAKRVTDIVSKLKGEYGSVLGYLHIFCNAFRIWCKDDDEQKSLELAITCIAEAVCVQYEQTNFSGFTIFELSIMCNSFRKFPENPNTFKAALAIAKYVSEYDLADLLKNNSECLVFFVKTFSLLSENNDELESFKRAVHVIACAIFTQLKNLDYAVHCSPKNLVNLALYVSRCPVDNVKFPYMQKAIVSISLCFNNEQGLNKLPDCSLEVLGKLTLAYSHWRDNTVIQRCILFIGEQMNKMDNTVIKNLKAKYLNYFLTGFSKFLANNYDDQSLKSLVLASCNVVIAHEVEDLKKHDKIFLSLLDQHFSKLSENWDCHKAVIAIRQLSKPFELVFGKTVQDIFVKVKGIADNEIKILLKNDPLELSKLAVGCSTFLYFDDSCQTLKRALVAIAKCISDRLASDAVFKVSDAGKNENDAEANANAANSNVIAKSSDSSLQRPIYEADLISNFVFAFCNNSPDDDFRPAMSVFAKYLTSCTPDMLDEFDDEQMHKLRIYLRAWCDHFPSVVMNVFDTALNNVSKNFLIQTQHN